MNTASAPRRARAHASRIWADGLTSTRSTPYGTGASTGPLISMTAAPRDGRGRGEGEAHLARRAVGQEAHRVDRLARRPGGDDDRAPGELPRAPRGGQRRLDDPLGLGHAAPADLALGQPAVLGLDDLHAARASAPRLACVAGCSNMRCSSPARPAPAPCRGVERREQVVGDARANLARMLAVAGATTSAADSRAARCAGSSRRRRARTVSSKPAPARERLQRQRRDEPCGVPRQDDLDLDARPGRGRARSRRPCRPRCRR